MRARAGIRAAESPSDQRFSLREAARILQVPEARLRALARAGFQAPQRGPVGPPSFGFQDLLVLRTTKGLLESGVPMRRIRRVWTSLRRQLAAGLPLTRLDVHADGEEIVASDGDARWQPDSGQMLLDFGRRHAPEHEDHDDGKEAEPAADERRGPRLSIVEGTGPLPPGDARSETIAGRPGSGTPRDAAPHGEDDETTADEWYEAGCDLEESSPEEAREAYERALALDPNMAGAHVNLGRQYHLAGERGRAEPHYREAARLDPDDPTPHFNLGVMLEEAGRRDEAVHAYRQAVLRDPDFADAHCNLGLLLEALGRRQEAVRHLMAARQLSGQID